MPTPNYFRFSPDILRRLGEELIPNIDQGIIELVRNAYDADADNCRVEIEDSEELGGTLRVIDDGVGMTEANIQSGWLVLGRSSKSGHQPTKKGRLPVGDKGLGRLAALRFGSKVVLTTRPKSEPGSEYIVTFNWADFDQSDTVESVAVNIIYRATTASHGTAIEITGLKIRIEKQDIERLARSLMLLASPFRDSDGFHPKLIAPSFEDLTKRVNEFYFDAAVFKLVAKLNEDGTPEAIVYSSNGSRKFVATEADFTKPYMTAAATLEIWVFILDRLTFATRSSKISEVREWLGKMGGVHLYHRGLRVHPYGDSGHDWLEMNLRRAQNPELRPSTNTSIGRVVVDDPEELLLQKTDRTGFVENRAFLELKRFACDALEWMAKERMRERESRRQGEHTTLPMEMSNARREVISVINRLPPESRPVVKVAIKELERVREKEVKTLREDLQLYRTLATVGTTSAVFAHESAQPVTRIEKAADEVLKRTNQEIGLFDREEVGALAQIIQHSVKAIRSFAGLPLNLLMRKKRHLGPVNVHEVVESVHALFEPFFHGSHIRIELNLADNVSPSIYGSVTALESILANLLTNAAATLIYAKPKPTQCLISIQTFLSGDNVVLRVLDNGPGIQNIGIDDIWLPGRSTRAGGTGLGLTIVKDAVNDLGGSVSVMSPGELGGAEFIVALPITGEAK